MAETVECDSRFHKMWLGVRNYFAFPFFNTADDDLEESSVSAKIRFSGSRTDRRFAWTKETELAQNIDCYQSAFRGDKVLFERDPFRTSDFGIVNFIAIQGTDVYYQVYRETVCEGRTLSFAEMQDSFNAELFEMRKRIGVREEESVPRASQAHRRINKLNVLSINLLDPKLLFEQWESSYKLDPGLLDQHNVAELTRIRMNYTVDFLMGARPDVILLQEISAEKYRLHDERAGETTGRFLLEEFGSEYDYFESYKIRCRFGRSGGVETRVVGSGCAIMCRKHLHAKFMNSNTSACIESVDFFDGLDDEGWYGTGSCFITVNVAGTAFTSAYETDFYDSTCRLIRAAVYNVPHVFAESAEIENGAQISASDPSLIVVRKAAIMPILKASAKSSENQHYFFASDGTLCNDEWNFPISDQIPVAFIVNVRERNS